MRRRASDRTAGNRRIEIDAAAADRMDAADQFVGGGALQHVAGDAEVEQLAQIGAVFMHGQHQHAAVRTRGEELARHLDAVEAGHRQIEHGDVRLQFRGAAERVRAITGLADHFESGIACHQRLHAAEHHRVIVGDKHAQSGRGLLVHRSCFHLVTAECARTAQCPCRARIRFRASRRPASAAHGCRAGPAVRTAACGRL